MFVLVSAARVSALPAIATHAPLPPLPSSLRLGRQPEIQALAPALPPLKPHPLPPTLVNAGDLTGDYFDQVQPVSVGYLVWSEFPVKVCIEPVSLADWANPFTAQRATVWVSAVTQAVQDWQRYLPLAVVSEAKEADVVVRRSPPPLQLSSPKSPSSNSGSGNLRESRPTLPISRARSAETRFELYVKPMAIGTNRSVESGVRSQESGVRSQEPEVRLRRERSAKRSQEAGNPTQSLANRSTSNILTHPPTLSLTHPPSHLANQPTSRILAHRMTILLRPDQAAIYLKAAARHELGHALGIWGHSPEPTDVLYFSQVRNPPASLSARDINTLKRIYAQPTRLGWALPSAE